MLAYVFSHRPAGGVTAGSYEESLRRFHAALARAAPTGFIASATFRMAGAYSDWYVLESSAALDALNVAAVSGERAASHNAAARMAAGGTGKLLSLAAGDYSMAAGYEVRFSKPTGMTYADLYARLQSWTAPPGVSLWRRMMVLGPPPEFCLITPAEARLQEEMQPEVVRREPV
jgi:hypothetical protein